MREKSIYQQDINEQYRPKVWQEGIALTEQELEAIFQRDDFKTNLSQAMAQTKPQPGKKGQEFGFVVGHLSDRRINRQNGFARPASSFFVSPLFAGDETSIDVYTQLEDYKLQRIYDYYKEPIPILHFHTHPDTYPLQSLGFSLRDLKNIKWATHLINPNIVYSVGAKASYYERVLFLSFNNSRAWRNFNPSEVYTETLPYSSKMPFRRFEEAYNEAGLNVAELIVFPGGEIPKDEVKKASRILTTRTD